MAPVQMLPPVVSQDGLQVEGDAPVHAVSLVIGEAREKQHFLHGVEWLLLNAIDALKREKCQDSSNRSPI